MKYEMNLGDTVPIPVPLGRNAIYFAGGIYEEVVRLMWKEYPEATARCDYDHTILFGISEDQLAFSVDFTNWEKGHAFLRRV